MNGRLFRTSRTNRRKIRSKDTCYRADIKKAFLANYWVAIYHCVQFMADHLADCRKSFGGDFDHAMILPCWDNGSLARWTRCPKGRSRRCAGLDVGLADCRCHGIPRETVRRKLGELKARGWVENNRSRGWRLAGRGESTPAKTELAELDERYVDRFSRMFAALAPTLLSHPRTPPGDD